jgi:hypothetical protein
VSDGPLALDVRIAELQAILDKAKSLRNEMRVAFHAMTKHSSACHCDTCCANAAAWLDLSYADSTVEKMEHDLSMLIALRDFPNGVGLQGGHRP